MIRQKITSLLFRRFRESSRKKIQAIDNGSLYAAMTEYMGESETTGCGWEDYWLLYVSIRKYKPQEILECGTGLSTLVMAHAVIENGSGRITSMEENKEWLEKARRLLPEKYANVTDLRFSETMVETHAMFRGIRYRDTPERNYDFVFIDGPNEAEGVKASETCDMDFIHVLRRSKNPIRGIVDTRTGTFWTLAHILGLENVRYSYLLRQGIILPCTAKDLRHPRHIINLSFMRHVFKRPAWSEYRL